MLRLEVYLVGALLAAGQAISEPIGKNDARSAKHEAIHALRSAKGGATCVLDTISCGQTVTGSLVLESDCGLDDGTVVDFYSFMVNPGQQITADLVSNEFDAYLFLLDSVPEVVAEDDDGGVGTNSRIVYEFSTGGEASLVANSLFPEEGDYSLSLSCSGGSEPYSLHEHWSQIFWNPGLNGWGFAIDIQKGVLFGAVYGYDNSGNPTFYTLISDKVSANSVFNFGGDVFQTTGNGSSTSDVGNFTFELVPFDGQPGARLTMTSPSANFNDLELVRFGFLDSDELSILSGQLATLAIVDNQQINDEAGGIVLFGNERTVVNGDTGIVLTTANPDAAGFFFYDADNAGYVVLLTSVTNSDVGILEGVVTDHKDMTGIGVLVNSSGAPLSGESIFRISALGADELSNKTLRDKLVGLRPSEKQVEAAITAYQTWRRNKTLD